MGKRTKPYGYFPSDKRSPTYHAWVNMRQRCNNPKSPIYHNYGARGIKVCERWDTFANFLGDMGEQPKGLSIDRIDNNGNYEPSNCRWAAQDTQMQNTRRTRLSPEKVAEIRALYATGNFSHRELGKMYGVRHGLIGYATRHETWSNV